MRVMCNHGCTAVCVDANTLATMMNTQLWSCSRHPRNGILHATAPSTADERACARARFYALDASCGVAPRRTASLSTQLLDVPPSRECQSYRELNATAVTRARFSATARCRL